MSGVERRGCSPIEPLMFSPPSVLVLSGSMVSLIVYDTEIPTNLIRHSSSVLEVLMSVPVVLLLKYRL
jgi:hypothetical protein